MGTKHRLDSLKIAGCGGHGICLDGNTQQCSDNVITGCSVQNNVSCHDISIACWRRMTSRGIQQAKF